MVSTHNHQTRQGGEGEGERGRGRGEGGWGNSVYITQHRQQHTTTEYASILNLGNCNDIHLRNPTIMSLILQNETFREPACAIESP